MSEANLLDKTVEGFVRGFSFTRSFTHPYEVHRVGPLWLLRDAPRKRPPYRTEEWVAWNIAPKDVDKIVQKKKAGRLAISHICSGDGSDPIVRQAYKELGYRLRCTEPMMMHTLKRIPTFDSPATIERVTDQATADKLAKAARSRQVLPEHLAPDSKLRQYIAVIDDEIVGWVRSIVVGESTWCSNMFVKKKFRRRGIGKALLSRMLKDDRKFGSKLGVLTASHTGAMLYPLLGYEQIATLLLYSPRKK